MRINKYIAQAGIASRRKADELVVNGNVKVNGAVMKVTGYDVADGEVVEVNGTPITIEKKLKYFIINKPIGYITTSSDELNRPTVMELVADIDARLFPVGRLDYNTSGMLIMTNDGDLAYKLTHPKHHIYKTYRARVAGVLSNEKVAVLQRGVDIGGYITSEAKVKIIKGAPHSTIVEIQIYEGKNRQVRKMFAAVGNKVQELERIAIGDIYMSHLKEGHYRKLTREEIEYLKNS